MDAQRNAPNRPEPPPHRPQADADAGKPADAWQPGRIRLDPRIGQYCGLLVAALILLIAFLFNSPAGDRMDLGPREHLFFLLVVVNIGSVLAAVGLVLARSELAWAGASAVLGIVFLHGPLSWFLVPFGIGLLVCVLLWEAARPRPPAPALPPPPPSYGYGYGSAPPWGQSVPYVSQGWVQVPAGFPPQGPPGA